MLYLLDFNFTHDYFSFLKPLYAFGTTFNVLIRSEINLDVLDLYEFFFCLLLQSSTDYGIGFVFGTFWPSSTSFLDNLMLLFIHDMKV